MSVPSWHRVADDLTAQVRELQADLAAMTKERERWEWVARHRRALRVRGTVEFSWGWECVLRDEQPGENEVDWLLASYQPADTSTLSANESSVKDEPATTEQEALG